eukprot:3330119-Rhodomonas_salina.3
MDASAAQLYDGPSTFTRCVWEVSLGNVVSHHCDVLFESHHPAGERVLATLSEIDILSGHMYWRLLGDGGTEKDCNIHQSFRCE